MKTEEVNKVLAEYEFGKDIWLMDGCVEANYKEGYYSIRKPFYTNSLDSLVPIWEKLGFWEFRLHGNSAFIEVPTFETHVSSVIGESDNCKTIQEAAALATARAVLELKEREK